MTPCSLSTHHQNTIHYKIQFKCIDSLTLAHTLNCILLVNIIYYHYIVENSKHISV
nr:MAG TPA: hypothetical protein [Bacteriophage sp.]